MRRIGHSGGAAGELACFVCELRSNASHQRVGGRGAILLRAHRGECEGAGFRVLEPGAGARLLQGCGQVHPGSASPHREVGNRFVVLDRIRQSRQQLVFDQTPGTVRFRPAHGLLEGESLLHDAPLRKRRIEVAKPPGQRSSRTLIERLARLLRVPVELGNRRQDHGIKIDHRGSLRSAARPAGRPRRGRMELQHEGRIIGGHARN